MQNNLKELRKSKGMSTRRLGIAINTSHAQISNLEKGKCKLTVEWAVRLSKALNCTAADVIGYEVLGITK